ncbi:MAG: TolC family protein [Phycisphaeraceae bacterium]|nr:TolC family protein [Phycisphaeraceae bacterium]
MYRWCCCAVAFTALGLGGCQMHPLADSSWPEARPLGERLETYHPPTRPMPPDAHDQLDIAEPTGDLTLRQAMALAIARSPKLRAYGWDVRRAEAQMLQAELWPNPEVEAEFEDFGGNKDLSGTQSLQATISLAQTFPLGGDIQRRRELAAYEARLVGWDYEAARLELLTEVTQRYVALLAAQRRVNVAEEALILADQVQATTRKRIDAGAAPPIEAARASVPVATARVALVRAERQHEAARKQLSLMWAAGEPTFGAVSGSLEQLATLPTPEQLVALINQNPDVARWATEISARQAEVRLAKAELVPDITARLGYRRFNESDGHALVAGISLPLPVFDRRQGDILSARLGALSDRQRQRDAELRLETALSDAYARLASAFEEATAIREEALPPATKAFDVTRIAFEKGDVTFIDVLDAERTLIELRTQHLDALAGYHTAVAEIEALIGQSLESLNTPSTGSRTEQHGDE